MSSIEDLVHAAERLEDEVRDVFTKFDYNRDGTLQPEELEALLEELELPASEAEVFRLFNKFDEDRSGEISFEEHYNFLKGEAAQAFADREKLDAVLCSEAARAQVAVAEIAAWRRARDLAVRSHARPAAAGLGSFHSPHSPHPGSSSLGGRSSDTGGFSLPPLEDAELLARLFTGASPLAELETLDQPPGLWLFVSSTFVDTHTERNYFMAYVFPDLKELCANLGLTFDSLDLRWGVTDAATDNHGTQELCAAEIERCHRQSQGLSFLFLAGERYGWKAIPKRCPVKELELLSSYLHGSARDEEALAAIKAWYALDTNAIPEEYVLRNKREVRADAAVPPERRDFQVMEPLIAEAVRRVTAAAELSTERTEAWTLSITHHEVKRCLEGFPSRAAIIHRTLTGLKDAFASGTDAAAQEYYAPPEDHKLLDQLRRDDLRAFPPARVARFTAPWRRDDPISFPQDTEYLRKVGASLFATLAADAEDVAVRRAGRALPALEQDVVAHAVIAARRSAAFLGRESLRRAALALARPAAEPSRPRVIHGPSGSGKTSLMSLISCHRGDGVPEGAVTVCRFCGTSLSSSSARGVLRSICLQILRAYGASAAEIEAVPETLKDLARNFPRYVAENATAARPLHVMIDSLDQLTDQEGGRSRLFDWLPAVVPAWCALVVSTLTDDETHRYGILPQLQQNNTDARDFVSVGLILYRDCQEILNSMLAQKRRKVTEDQMSILLRSAQDGATALQLKLLAGEAAKMTAWLRPGTLPSTVPALINRLYDRLECDHTPALTSRVLGLLAASQAGLSTQNLLDAVSASDDVLGWRGKRGTVMAHSEPPVRRLPPLVFVRLLDEIREFVVERGGVGGTTVLVYYHRQFHVAARKRYMGTAGDRGKLLGLLADLFSGRLAARFPTRGIDPHKMRLRVSGLPVQQTRISLSAQALVELPAALLALGELGRHAARPQQLAVTLTDLDHIFSAAASGRLSSLAGSLVQALTQLSRALVPVRRRGRNVGRSMTGSAAVQAVPASTPASVAAAASMRKEVLALHAACFDTLRWLQIHGSQLNAAPSQTYVEALNAPQGSAPERAVRALTVVPPPIPSAPGSFKAAKPVEVDEAGAPLRLGGCWGRRDKPAAFPACLAVLKGHTDKVLCSVFNPNGQLLATGSADKTVKIWSIGTGELLQTCTGPQGHTGPVQSVCFSMDGKTLASGGGGNDYDVTLGKAVVLDSSVRLWLVSTGEHLHTLALGEVGGVNSVAFSMDNAVIAVGTSEKPPEAGVLPSGQYMAVHLFHAVTGKLDRLLEEGGHRGSVNAVAWSPDGKMLATGGGDYVSLIWSAGDYAVLRELVGHSKRINAIAFSTSSKLVCTASNDKSARIWLVSTGEVMRVLNHAEVVRSVAFDITGDELAVACGDELLRVWAVDGNGNKPARTLTGHSDLLECVAYSPDGQVLVSSSYDKTIRLFSTINAVGGPATGHKGEIFFHKRTNDDLYVMTGSLSDKTVRFWDSHTCELVATVKASLDEFQPVVAVHRTDGKPAQVAAAMVDGSIILWPACGDEQQNPVRIIKGAFEYIPMALAYAPDGTTIGILSSDKVGRLFSAETGELVTEVRGKAGDTADLSIYQHSDAFGWERQLTWGSGTTGPMPAFVLISCKFSATEVTLPDARGFLRRLVFPPGETPIYAHCSLDVEPVVEPAARGRPSPSRKKASLLVVCKEGPVHSYSALSTFDDSLP